MNASEQMVLASRLTDGHAVFLTADGGWVEDNAAGAVAAAADAAQRLHETALQAEARNTVVEPYLIAVRRSPDRSPGQRQPVSFREAIRASGPTVRTDLVG